MNFDLNEAEVELTLTGLACLVNSPERTNLIAKLEQGLPASHPRRQQNERAREFYEKYPQFNL